MRAEIITGTVSCNTELILILEKKNLSIFKKRNTPLLFTEIDFYSMLHFPVFPLPQFEELAMRKISRYI